MNATVLCAVFETKAVKQYQTRQKKYTRNVMPLYCIWNDGNEAFTTV